MFLRIVKQRDKQTLHELIRQHVYTGSIIVTDCWAGYNGIEEYGYTHLRVNHSISFSDQETGACTNRIEGNWNGLKLQIPPRNRTVSCEANLCEVLWRRLHAKNRWNGFIAASGDVDYTQ